jgi:glutathione peroxidase-family protein
MAPGRELRRAGGSGGMFLRKRKRKVENQKKIEKVVRSGFDSQFYLTTYPDVKEAKVDPVRHYLEQGWLEGRNPRGDFDTKNYLYANWDVLAEHVNPFYHYLAYGKAEGRNSGSNLTPEDQTLGIEEKKEIEKVVRGGFDSKFYLTTYPDVKEAEVDPVTHYLEHGWIEGRNPRGDFNTRNYLYANWDVLVQHVNPFYHYLAYGKAEGRNPGRTLTFDDHNLLLYAPHILQDSTFPLGAEKAEAILVIVVPEHNEMSGGIYSMFSIAKAAYDMRHKHNYRILLMTRPNPHDQTYLRQTNFRNYEDVFRFEQIVRCHKAKEIYLHIPEYALESFARSLSDEVLQYLRSRRRLYINILNQNIDLMPKREKLEDCRALATELTQSVAHHAYSGQEVADRYDLPTLLLPAYTDLSGYEPIELEEKEKLIIYSPDSSAHRKGVLTALESGLPDYRLLEIRSITFDKFMDLATRCRFSISFGEGFDGYVAQPIHQNGIGLAVYKEQFFPSAELRAFPNFFSSEDDMIKNIVARIRQFEADPKFYREINKRMKTVYEKLYSKEDYLRRVEMLINRDFEVAPSGRLRNVIGGRF